jgi:hypothetical protein
MKWPNELENTTVASNRKALLNQPAGVPRFRSHRSLSPNLFAATSAAAFLLPTLSGHGTDAISQGRARSERRTVVR